VEATGRRNDGTFWVCGGVVNMYVALGQTDSGRYLSVFFIHRPGNLALVIGARDMDAAERKRYGRK
jgi:uncharacterized DUF497 family protein